MFFLLGMLTILFLLGIVVINSFFTAEVRAQQENATDAAALAAAEVLVQEALLYADPSIFDLSKCSFAMHNGSAGNQGPFCQATNAAIAFAAKNYVGGKALRVQAKEIFFNEIDIARRTNLGTMPAIANSGLIDAKPLTLAMKRRLNSVQVMGRSASSSRENPLRFPIDSRSNFHLVTRSEAVLDGFVLGFHTDPHGAITIPMAPAALNSDSWRRQVEQPVDPTFATPADGPLPYGDFSVHLGAPAHDPHARHAGVYAPILLIGTATAAEALRQFDPRNPGITPAHYGNYLAANNQKPFALDPKMLTLSAPASPFANAEDIAQLELNLLGLKDRRLIWPLYSAFDDRDGPGRVTITGFVAARIIGIKKNTYSVTLDENGKARGKFKGLCNEQNNQGRHRGKRNDDGQDSEPKGDGADDNQGNEHAGKWPRFRIPGQDDTRPGDDDSGMNGLRGRGGLCVEFGAIQITLRPTMLATSTAMVSVKDWPTGSQQHFRFPNAYVKRIRLVK